MFIYCAICYFYMLGYMSKDKYDTWPVRFLAIIVFLLSPIVAPIFLGRSISIMEDK